MSDENQMTLQERFDDHVARAKDAEVSARTSYGSVETFHMQRAQLHATLALAIAQRMTAEATAKMNEAVQQKKIWDI